MGDAFQARATHERSRNLRSVSALCVGIAIALSGCSPDASTRQPVEYGVLRTRLFQDCMDHAAKVTPPNVADRGSWSEIVSQCGDQAYYQANTCTEPKACLAALPASFAKRDAK